MIALRAGLAVAEPASDAAHRDERLAALERQVQALTEEIARLRTESAVPEEKALASERGYAPAASRVFGVARGLSVGGYGELNYVNPIADTTSLVVPDREIAIT